jgi:asparagine synthase (glutamine-hydrolysing)
MSAIAGILNFDGRPVESEDLGVMTRAVAHRGPDGSGKWIDGPIGLGHQMLWTLPEAVFESLPRHLANRLFITGDVRLDNRKELLDVMGNNRFPIRSLGDCGLVMAAYEKWGENCVEHLLGDFAFAIWDKKAQKLFCARDHMGIKPFYYAFMPGDRFVFATEIKAILALPGIPDSVNEQSLADGFVHLLNDPASTYYSHVSTLPAAHSLTVSTAISKRRYWRLNPEKELRLKSDHEYAEGFRDLFSQAVQCRLRSSHPVGAMLSGGLDSSSVACVARDFLRVRGGQRLQTFSAVFDEVIECDERAYIRTVLEQGHCEPNFIVMDSLSPLSDAESITWHLDEPLSAANLYLNWNAYRKAKKIGVRVMLDGFDGDTTVSHGVARLAELAEAGKWWNLATELRGSSESLNLDSWVKCWCSWFSRYNPAGRTANRIWGGGMRRLQRFKPESPLARSWDRIGVLNPDLAQRLGSRDVARKPAVPFKDERDRHFRMLERSVMAKTVEVLNHSAAAFDVDVRFPFMDIRLIEYCLSLPSNQKLRGGCTRFVMHNAMAGILPDKIKRRAGKANLAPSFQKGLKKFEEINLKKNICEQKHQLGPYVDLSLINKFLDHFQRGAASENEVNALWAANGLALWLRARHAQNNLSYNERG